jgi:hypothetical protein
MATPVAAGVTAASLAAAGTLQFADRYEFVQVENPGATAIYASADPAVTSPTSSTNNTVMVPAGGSAVLSNRNPLWYQSSNVIAKGVIRYGNGNTATSPASPGLVTPMESLAGQMANPGTTVSVSGACTVSAAG